MRFLPQRQVGGGDLVRSAAWAAHFAFDVRYKRTSNVICLIERRNSSENGE